MLDRQKQNGFGAVTSFPEFLAGNPMDAPPLVRYLPSRPGYFTGVGIETYGPMISVRTRPGFDLLRVQ